MKLFITICWSCLCLAAWSENRVWTLKNGQTIEGEHLSLVGKKTTIRTVDNKTLLIPLNDFCDEDIQLIEVLNPPKLDFDFKKTRVLRRFPAVLWGDQTPQAYRYNFSLTIKQLSTSSYNHQLHAELFVIGREAYGHRNILLDHIESPFLLEGYNSVFTMESKKTVKLATFVIGGGASARKLGKEYAGYLVIVRDSRGEIIAHSTTSKNLFENFETLKALPVGSFFDKSCTRCSPTRPKPYY